MKGKVKEHFEEWFIKVDDLKANLNNIEVFAITLKNNTNFTAPLMEREVKEVVHYESTKRIKCIIRNTNPLEEWFYWS